MKKLVTLALLLLFVSGCKVFELSWNKVRLGYLTDERVLSEDGTCYYDHSYTVGLILQWWPDINWTKK